MTWLTYLESTFSGSLGDRTRNHRSASVWCAGDTRVRAGRSVHVFWIGMRRFGIFLCSSSRHVLASSSSGGYYGGFGSYCCKSLSRSIVAIYRRSLYIRFSRCLLAEACGLAAILDGVDVPLMVEYPVGVWIFRVGYALAGGGSHGKLVFIDSAFF